jgi:hypothetical protein
LANLNDGKLKKQSFLFLFDISNICPILLNRFCTRIFKLKNLSWWGSETNLVPVVELRQSASISIRYLTTTTISNPTSNTNTTVPQRPKRLRKSKSPTLATDVVEGDRPPPEVLEKRKKGLYSSFL